MEGYSGGYVEEGLRAGGQKGGRIPTAAGDGDSALGRG